MKITKDDICFDAGDRVFIDRFGIMESAQMALDFALTHRHPFLFDAFQLAHLLGFPSRRSLFALTRCIGQHYHPVEIPKRNGGCRRLTVPDSYLSRYQREINRLILHKLPISKYATAYFPGAAPVKGAKKHLGRKYLLKLDIKDFFDSVTFSLLMNNVFHSGNFPKQIGVMLCKLCTFKGRLPQGAPTSPMLSNLVMRPFDELLGKKCAARGITYTRYCDDMTFSADTPLYFLPTLVEKLLGNMGLVLNPKKTRFITCGSRQTVTGIVVNEKLSLPAPQLRALRQEVYYVLKFGAADTLLKTQKREFFTLGAPDPAHYLRHLLGKIEYLASIRPLPAFFADAKVRLYEELKSL